HLLRAIDHFVDLSAIRQHLAPFYSPIGRPSIDPELMIRMLIVGYCFGIRSERRLCEEVHLNLAYRWFCRLGLEGDVPDHSTFSKNRHGRFRDSDLLRELFETTVRRCIEEGLVGNEGFAVDASLIRADANKQRSADGSEQVDWETMAATRRSVQEYLDTLDDAGWGAASEVKPKFVSRSDPAAQWTGAMKGHPFFAYATNYLIDLNHAVIVDVEASRAIRQAEVGAARTMIERVQDRFNLYPERLAADSAYGSAEMLGWLVHERGIEPHIPVFDKSERRDGTFERAEFSYDRRRDLYTCPGGKELRQYRRRFASPREGVDDEGFMRYRASKLDCDACALQPRCCPNAPARKILRSIHEGARDMARDIAATDTYVTSRRERKKVEMLFAHLKRILKLDRLRLRGPNGARDEFHLAAAAQNLRKLAKLIPVRMPKPA
ncbi:transposase, partial [Mesorhizobium sp. M0664]|uniref:IS1182 family transposase n=1 Tax=Mesorhizobium sp. M0664 TaxID=2956982 RepID=UPI00333838EF